MKHCLLLLLALCCAFAASAASETYRVTARALNVRSAPGQEAPILSSLPQGQRVQVAAIDTCGWARIAWRGTEAYVSADYLEKLGAEETESGGWGRFPLYDFPGGHVPSIPRTWLTTGILLLSVALMLVLCRAVSAGSSNWVAGMTLFLLLAGCEIYSVLMLGGDCVWFCMPGEVGVWRMIVNFVLFGFVLIAQFVAYMALLVNISRIELPASPVDWRWGFWSLPVAVIATLALGGAAGCVIIPLFILYQFGFMVWIIWKFARGGKPGIGIFMAFFYLGGALVTLMTAAFYLPMLILVVLAFIALQFVAASRTYTIYVRYE